MTGRSMCHMCIYGHSKNNGQSCADSEDIEAFHRRWQQDLRAPIRKDPHRKIDTHYHAFRYWPQRPPIVGSGGIAERLENSSGKVRVMQTRRSRQLAERQQQQQQEQQVVFSNGLDFYVDYVEKNTNLTSNLAEEVVDISGYPEGANQTMTINRRVKSTDWPNIFLLIALYLLQGVPLGLAMGSMPFLLKRKQISYSQMATFSLSSYPYSLKLLWSPIVDSVFWRSVGRRRSWIIPIQTVIGIILYLVGMSVDDWLAGDAPDISFLAFIFTVIVFFSATQDIAVDGWALTLLSDQNLSYASTCQTIGLNTGYFLSFVIFLALNSPKFCNQYFRTVPSEAPILQLGAYLQFWAICYLIATAAILLFKTEAPEKNDSKSKEVISMSSTYQDMLKIFQLDNMKTLIVILLVAKIGFIANDSATAFKLLEKGFNEEDLAITALINFPLQIIFGFYAAKWSAPPSRLKPWLFAFYGRLLVSIFSMFVLSIYPSSEIDMWWYFPLVIGSSVLGSFMSSVQFVSLGAFFAVIADPSIGGTYMTLLNTLSNFGGTWPQYFVLKAVDLFTIATCSKGNTDCSSKEFKAECNSVGGTCLIVRDGYYAVNSLSVLIGFALLMIYIKPNIHRLERLAPAKWRLGKRK